MVFRRIGKSLRDKTAEKICRGLCAIGVPATLAEGAPLEEKLESGHPSLRQFLPHRESLGLIDIAEWPIRWVNIVGISGTLGLSDQALPEHRCWVIAETWGESLGLGLSPPAPSAELWRCYEAIARHLLAEWKGHED